MGRGGGGTTGNQRRLFNPRLPSEFLDGRLLGGYSYSLVRLNTEVLRGRMRLLASLRAIGVAAICAVWLGLVVTLPWLISLPILVQSYRRGNLAAFGAGWTDARAAVTLAVVPPALLILAWWIARRRSDPHEP